MTTNAGEPTSASKPTIDVYWRPGCGFCGRLERDIRAHQIDATFHNIWDDPAAAAFVRSVARGNETVPTVTVAGLSMVNPSIHDVLAAFADARS